MNNQRKPVKSEKVSGATYISDVVFAPKVLIEFVRLGDVGQKHFVKNKAWVVVIKPKHQKTLKDFRDSFQPAFDDQNLTIRTYWFAPKQC